LIGGKARWHWGRGRAPGQEDRRRPSRNDGRHHLHALSRLLDQADKLNTLADQINLDGSIGPQVVDIAIGSRDTRARRIDLMRSYDGSNGGSPCLEGLRYAPALVAEEKPITAGLGLADPEMLRGDSFLPLRAETLAEIDRLIRDDITRFHRTLLDQWQDA
jgi:hypothetical protein